MENMKIMVPILMEVNSEFQDKFDKLKGSYGSNGTCMSMGILIFAFLVVVLVGLKSFLLETTTNVFNSNSILLKERIV